MKSVLSHKFSVVLGNKWLDLGAWRRQRIWQSPLDDGLDALVRFVQGDFQRFIAESHFEWGNLRGLRDLP